MTDSPSGRTRTPPDLKWLLNERAAMAGRIQQTEARQRSLEARLPRYQRQLEKALNDLPNLEKSLSAYQATLKALDTTIALAYQSVRPDAAGKVNAWAGKYGHRGAFEEYVVRLLQDAAPNPVNARHVAYQVVEHFGIQLRSPADKLTLGTAIKNSFARLHQKGLIEPSHGRVKGSNQPGVWRWKQPIPTLSDLAAKAQRMAQAAADASDAHPPSAHSSEANREPGAGVSTRTNTDTP